MFLTVSISIAFKGVFLTKKGIVSAKNFANPTVGLFQACSLVPSPLALTFVGLVYIAETGWNYRQFKMGKIDKKEF